MHKDFETLRKKINLHENEIKRIQGIAKKCSYKIGENDGELKRLKDKSRKQNLLFNETKAIVSSRHMHSQSQNQFAMNTNLNNDGTGLDGLNVTYNKLGQNLVQFAQTFTNINNRNQNTKLLKNEIKKSHITKFNIRPGQGFDRPINVNSDLYNKGNNISKINKFLHYEKKEQMNYMPSLTSLYDENLREIQVKLLTSYFHIFLEFWSFRENN